MQYQTTIAKDITFSGIGVHCGLESTITIKPASENFGIKFKRIDIKDDSISCIDANYSNVIDAKLCTLIANKHGIKISTIEHLMSSLYGMNIDNALVEINSEEMPIMDGSSIAFAQELKRIGLRTLDAPRQYIKALRNIEVREGDKYIKLSPSSNLSIRCTVDYENKFIGKQTAFYSDETDYINSVSAARTFGFAHEIEMLKKIGLARGGSLENAIGVSEDGIMNPEGLRYSNEFAMHKLLDCLGDLYTSGKRLLCSIDAYKTSHALNNALLHELFSDPQNYEIFAYNDIGSIRSNAAMPSFYSLA